MERCVKVLISDGVSNRHQNSLTLLLNDLVADEWGTLDLSSTSAQSQVDIGVLLFRIYLLAWNFFFLIIVKLDALAKRHTARHKLLLGQWTSLTLPQDHLGWLKLLFGRLNRWLPIVLRSPCLLTDEAFVERHIFLAQVFLWLLIHLFMLRLLVNYLVMRDKCLIKALIDNCYFIIFSAALGSCRFLLNHAIFNYFIIPLYFFNFLFYFIFALDLLACNFNELWFFDYLLYFCLFGGSRLLGWLIFGGCNFRLFIDLDILDLSLRLIELLNNFLFHLIILGILKLLIYLLNSSLLDKILFLLF